MNLDARIYWTIFGLAFIGISVWEVARPWRAASGQLVRRWCSNGAVVLVYGIVASLLSRLLTVLLAWAVQHSRFGLLHVVPLPFTDRVILGILLLDFFQYVQHRVFHSIPLLWRVHQVHHSDPEVDLSTGIRHHPLESLVAQLFGFCGIVLLAPPPAAVVAIQALLVCHIFFSHANANLPPRLEKLLRFVLITPEMHRIHHSDEMRDQQANLGELFPWWDRMFGTYLDAPVAGTERVRIGLKGCDEIEAAGLVFMLAQPFRSVPEPSSTPEQAPVAVSGD